MKNILILLTNQATMGNTDERNGTYAPELTHALHEFMEAGYRYDLASINGGQAPIYGEEADDDINKSILANDEFNSRLNNTRRVSEIKIEDYDAIFYPGGFGLLWDLAEDKATATVAATLFESGGVIGAVCHGPAGLLPITLSDGKSILEGANVTGFTREEEIDFGTIEKIPYLLEESLTRKAGRFSKVGPWLENVITEDRLITGQNPASAAGVAKAMIERLEAK